MSRTTAQIPAGHMLRRLSIAVLAAAALTVSATPAQALPISFNIASCVSGDCGSVAASGGGAIIAQLDIVNSNDLLITLTNALNRNAENDDPILTNLGFEYGSLLSGLTFESFTVLSGTVAAPVLTVNSSIRSFFIDFGFGFSQETGTSLREGRFQAMDPQEVVQIVIGTTGDVDLSLFSLGVAKVGGTGTNGLGGAAVLIGDPIASVPEPATLLLLLTGVGALARRRPFRVPAPRTLNAWR